MLSLTEVNLKCVLQRTLCG